MKLQKLGPRKLRFTTQCPFKAFHVSQLLYLVMRLYCLAAVEKDNVVCFCHERDDFRESPPFDRTVLAASHHKTLASPGGKTWSRGGEW